MAADKDVESNTQKIKYPTAVFFIVVNEFCERFSFYGMKTVLTLYLRDILLFDENESTVWYHLFVMLCYFTPVFGAILADTYLGKFKTILYLSILYAFGNVLLSVASIPNALPQKEFSLLGLFIIAVGTGGIKPCVSAFGGEQFIRPQQDRQLEQFFSVFYFAINAGSLISTFITPIFREDVKCFGNDSCYPLAFGVPAILMIVAVVVFVSGRGFYKITDPSGNIMVKVVKCMAHAVAQKCTNKGEKHDHWLDYAGKKFDRQLIQDIKQVLGVLLLYIPIPVFWALFDQQGSRWTFQATRMDGTLGSTSIKPDQLQIINPLLILALVPVFESIIYPCFKKCGLLTPLQRIGAGGLLAGLAFIISGIVELNLEPTYPRIPETGMTQLNFINTLPCSINVSYVNDNQMKWIQIDADGYSVESDLKVLPMEVVVKLSEPTCGKLTFPSSTWSGMVKGASTKAFSVVVSESQGNIEVTRLENEEPLEKSSTGQARLGAIIVNSELSIRGGYLLFKSEKRSYNISVPSGSMPRTSNLAQTEVTTLDAGTYATFAVTQNGSQTSEIVGGTITILPGGCYTFVARYDSEGNQSKSDAKLLMSIEVTPPNSVHMLWLFPQYFIVTVAEVMFSVTGLQFSFTQAPASMQSVMQAAWLLTIAFGNLIVIIVAEAKGIPRQSMEFFLFAGLMALDMLLFFFLASRYTYVQVPEIKSQDEEEKSNDESMLTNKPQNAETSGKQLGSENKGFSDDTQI